MQDFLPAYSTTLTPPASLSPSPASAALQIAFGPPDSPALKCGLPVLAGPAVEHLFATATPAGRAGAIALFRQGPWLLGGASVPASGGLEPAVRQLYTDLLRATAGLHLARIWNYVPAINQLGPDGLENYRLFSRGRSLAFEAHFGPGFKPLLPSASAVGAESDHFTVVFAATSARALHVENPLQVSAYDYPAEYGPRAPSFARATVVGGAQPSAVFISGTAAIRGHATVAPGELAPQLECTLGNLRQVSQACGLGPDLGRDGPLPRHFKVYVRRAEDHADVARFLRQKLLTAADTVTYLQADICRAALVVEIEVTLLKG